MTLSEALAWLAAERAAFLSALDSFGDTAERVPPGGGWSAAGVAEHLARVEGGALRLATRHLARGTDAGPPRPGGLDRVLAAMASPARIAMPEAVAAHVAPTGAPAATSAEALRGFDAAWSALAERHAAALQAEPAPTVFAHPAAGPLTLAGTVAFCAAHLAHHGPQLARIQQALAARGAAGG